MSSTTSTKIKHKIGKKSLDTEQLGVVKNLTPFEDITHLAGIASISLAGRRDIGALILQKKEDIQIKFCFDVQGIHPSLPEEQILPIFENIEGGLKELPERETLTIHLGSFTDDFLRQQELKKIEDKCDLEQLTLLVRSERLRARELTEAGTRKNKFLRFWCTYSVLASEDSRSNDAIEKTIKQLQNAWFKFTGQIHGVRQERIETILRDSFTSGFQRWEQLFTNSMGLSVRAVTSEEVWSILWSQFNRSDAPKVPNPLILDEEGLREVQTSDFHIRHLMLENEKSVPFLDRSWVRLQDKYIGVLQFSEKPQGWVDEYAQLRYLWEVISKEKISDTEIICQLSKANQGLAKTALQRITKQSITSSAMSSEKGSIDVKANMNIEEAVKAQETILRGSLPIHTAVVFCVHRHSRQKLDEACQYLSSCFLRPAVVDREIEYAWKTWLQCVPIVWENLLTRPFNRRLPYFSSEVPGLMPIVRTATGDKSGFELIAEEGGTPVHLDLYKQHKNLAIFGTTRAGKSVLVAGLLTPALAQDIPVIALDYPKPDGTSTFTDYTKFMGEEGAYFDISKESNNLFELPDLRGYEPELIKERMTDFKEFLKSTLMIMVLGTNPVGVSATMISNIESIITITIETFYNDEDIKLRYKLALENGVGTSEWADIPTLKDFYNYCSPGFIKLDSITNNSKEILDALDQIRLRLKFWLNSRVGQSIANPSSFKTDARLLVFALRSLGSEADAAVLALSAYSAALRRALSSKVSIFFLDEAPILFSFDSIAELIGRLCANGAKAGIRVILSAQEPESIFQSKSASKIFANITTRLIGRIQTSAVDPFVNRFKYPYEIISRNSTEAFFPKRESIYSQWLLDDNGKLTFCRYYPAYCLLAAVANNPNEQELRTLFLNKYADNPMLGMVRFSEAYIQTLRGDELSQEAQQLLDNNNNRQLKPA
ncbi:hypothetical protein CDG76_26545 [Nostoc sp. 'Peltigera membranacea cyanobiont' 210A]|uniref:hypothetical protein n=1 Tax=Nostoc sp. 'Peltigera membranacea cyanobiont' 210A TaxID=2014529 RepID=UPI000B95BB62|nr:hypothetical protein [Nostoc sp. 'Peltigera membranacea cyanobiont' 210A]OYD91464.1 hypothetical protein CDG76_26545 [Nostoc sp. 'Peltigera membranacea cyanobiont' 210A]